MNININDAFKSASTKSTLENKKKDDNYESFLKSFNKLLEKKRTSTKKKLENKSQGAKDKEKKGASKDLREHLNTNYLIRSYPEEKSLNTEVPFKSLDNMLVGNGEVLEELFQEETFNFEGLNIELKTELQNLGKDEEVIESLLDIDLEDEDSSKGNALNFSIEEAKADLEKALNKGVNGLSIEETKSLDLEDNEGLEGHKVLEYSERLEDKNELVSKESLMSKLKEIKENSSKVIDKPKKGISDSEINSISKPESVKETMDSLAVEDFKTIEDKSKDKGILETTEESANIEESKFVDTNILFNRIQSSIPEFEETSDILSTQNIQNVEESMIKFMKVSKEGDSSTMRVRLYPEELGSIDISLKLDKGKLIADIIVASDKIKDMFLNSSSVLNRNLIEQNVPIKSINITVNDTFNSLENPSGEAQDGESRGNNGQGQNIKGNDENSLNNSPIDNMRIDSINKRNIGNKSLDILV